MNEKANYRTLLGGITQFEMAMLVGTTRGQWSMFEIGKRPLPAFAIQNLSKLLSRVKDKKPEVQENKIVSKQVKEAKYKMIHLMVLENRYMLEYIKQKIEAEERALSRKETFTAMVGILNEPMQAENEKQTSFPIDRKPLKQSDVQRAKNLEKLYIRHEVLEFEQLVLEKRLEANAEN